MDYPHSLPHQPGWQGVSWNLQLLCSTSVHPLRLNQEDASRARTPAPPSSGVPTQHAQSLRGRGPHVLSCPLPTHARTLLPSHRPPCSSYTSTRTHSLPWVKARSLTHSLRLCSHTRRERHTFKRFSLHKGQHDSSYANRTGPRVRDGGQVGRRTLGGVGPYRFWEPGTGPSSLGALAPSWLPRGHCAQGMT